MPRPTPSRPLKGQRPGAPGGPTGPGAPGPPGRPGGPTGPVHLGYPQTPRARSPTAPRGPALGHSFTRVTHTYDWNRLTGQHRLARARQTTSDRLQASLDRLAELAERH